MFENLKHAVKRVLNFGKQNDEPCIENICICDNSKNYNSKNELYNNELNNNELKNNELKNNELKNNESNPRISSKYITFQYRNFFTDSYDDRFKNETQSDTTAIKMRKQRIREYFYNNLSEIIPTEPSTSLSSTTSKTNYLRKSI